MIHILLTNNYYLTFKYNNEVNWFFNAFCLFHLIQFTYVINTVPNINKHIMLSRIIAERLVFTTLEYAGREYR